MVPLSLPEGSNFSLFDFSLIVLGVLRKLTALSLELFCLSIMDTVKV